jgi:hypothetical protein
LTGRAYTASSVVVMTPTASAAPRSSLKILFWFAWLGIRVDRRSCCC